MKILFLALVVLLFGCDSKRSLNLPDYDVSSSIELKVRDLGFQIQKIDAVKVSAKLDAQRSSQFKQRWDELKQSYNKTSSLVKDNYTQDEKSALELEYRKTKEIWEYIVSNYPI